MVTRAEQNRSDFGLYDHPRIVVTRAKQKPVRLILRKQSIARSSAPVVTTKRAPFVVLLIHVFALFSDYNRPPRKAAAASDYFIYFAESAVAATEKS